MKLRATWVIDKIDFGDLDSDLNPVKLFSDLIAGSFGYKPTMTIESVARVMVTGPRTWKSNAIVSNALDEIEQWAFNGGIQKIQIVHGGADGLDLMVNAQVLIRSYGLVPHWLLPEVIRPDWYPDGKLDKTAGFKRNTLMASSDIDIACVFLMPCTKTACEDKPEHNTHGTDQAYQELKRLGIPIRVYQG